MNDDVKDANGTSRSESDNHRAPEHRTSDDDQQFDWVSERSSCSLPKVFATLRGQVQSDVNRRNSLRPNLAPYEFSMVEDINKFSVVLKSDKLQKSVTFNLTDHAISVTGDQGKQMFEVSVTFNDEGKCKLIVDDRVCEFWQVRRIALEELMFPSL